MKTTTIGTYKDNLLGINYNLVMVNSAKELSDKLKATLKANGIKYAQYNSYTNKKDYEDDDTCIETPPSEIYEYQNFFVLEKNNGDLVLLDGFRRLLWYAAPNTPILVKFYKEKDLTNQQILTLLVNLNHFKFFSNQQYHERGFSLLLKTVFNIDITSFRSTFDAYLSSNETKNSYSSYGRLTGQEKNEEIKNRIIGKHFVSDMKFLEKLNSTKYLCDQYMGALLYEERLKTDTEFDVNKFIELADKHSVLQELTVKYEKIGTDHSAKSQDVVNKIIEIYRNLFVLMAGGEVGKSFAEKQKECKDLVAQLKKDKTLVKLTGNTKYYEVERILEDMIKKGEKIEFVCVIHPNDVRNDSWRKERETELPYGLFKNIQFLGYTRKTFGGNDLRFGVKLNDKIECPITHNYGGYHGGGKKYTKLDMPMGSRNYDIDLFVRLEIEQEPKVKKPREIKKFAYQPHRGKVRKQVFVLAWTNKEALELFEAADIRLTANGLRDYVGGWGNDAEDFLKDIDQTQSAVYLCQLTENGAKIDRSVPPKKIK